MPVIAQAVQDQLPQIPQTVDLPETAIVLPLILFYPNAGELLGGADAGGAYDKWRHMVDVHVLFSRSDVARSDAAAKATVEQIRLAILPMTKNVRQFFQPSDPDRQTGVTRVKVVSYRRPVLNWGGVEYLAVTTVVQVEELLPWPDLPVTDPSLEPLAVES